MYRVIWNVEPGGAFDQMQELVSLHGELRGEFQEMLRELNEFLQQTPKTLGEDDGSGVRVYHIYPVVVHFTIDESDKRIDVRNVYLW